MKIILASQSKNRQEAMDIAGIPYSAMPADVNEKNVKEEDPKKRAIAIAKLKADYIASSLQEEEAIIIAADGFNVCGEEILEKPKDLPDAKRMLLLLSGNSTTFYTGLVMIHIKTGERLEKIAPATIWFRELSEQEIDDYISSTDVLQYSAAFSPLNTPAISFFTRIEGSASGFSHSLPLDIIAPQIKQWVTKKKGRTLLSR